jgi:protein-disulfide isomerase
MIARASLVTAALAALAAGCRPPPPAQPAPGSTASVELELRMTALEGRLAMLERLFGGGAGAAAPLPADSAERVARVEARLDKVVGFLKQAVRPEVDTSQLYAMPIDPRDPSLGPADAPVTIIEAYEFLCPYCSMLEPTLDRLRAEYPKTLRVVSKYMVIHGAPAIPSGLGACAAQRQGRWERYKTATWSAIWPTDGDVDRSQAEASAVEQHARVAGMDLERFKADVAPGGPCEQWLADSADVLEKFGTSGTPTVLINGRLADPRDYAGLKAAIEVEVARVKASGVAPGRYYDEVVMARGRREAVMITPFE